MMLRPTQELEPSANPARFTPADQIGDCSFELGDLTRRVANDCEKLVRA